MSRLLDHQAETIGCFASIPLVLANVAVKLAVVTSAITFGLPFFMPQAVQRGIDLTIALVGAALVFVIAAMAILAIGFVSAYFNGLFER